MFDQPKPVRLTYEQRFLGFPWKVWVRGYAVFAVYLLTQLVTCTVSDHEAKQAAIASGKGGFNPVRIQTFIAEKLLPQVDEILIKHNMCGVGCSHTPKSATFPGSSTQEIGINTPKGNFYLEMEVSRKENARYKVHSRLIADLSLFSDVNRRAALAEIVKLLRYPREGCSCQKYDGHNDYACCETSNRSNYFKWQATEAFLDVI